MNQIKKFIRKIVLSTDVIWYKYLSPKSKCEVVFKMWQNLEDSNIHVFGGGIVDSKSDYDIIGFVVAGLEKYFSADSKKFFKLIIYYSDVKEVSYDTILTMTNKIAKKLNYKNLKELIISEKFLKSEIGILNPLYKEQTSLIPTRCYQIFNDNGFKVYVLEFENIYSDLSKNYFLFIGQEPEYVLYTYILQTTKNGFFHRIDMYVDQNKYLRLISKFLDFVVYRGFKLSVWLMFLFLFLAGLYSFDIRFDFIKKLLAKTFSDEVRIINIYLPKTPLYNLMKNYILLNQIQEIKLKNFDDKFISVKKQENNLKCDLGKCLLSNGLDVISFMKDNYITRIQKYDDENVSAVIFSYYDIVLSDSLVYVYYVNKYDFSEKLLNEINMTKEDKLIQVDNHRWMYSDTY